MRGQPRQISSIARLIDCRVPATEKNYRSQGKSFPEIPILAAVNTGNSMPELEPQPTSRRPLQVVVADDDRDALLTLKVILEDQGHAVYEAQRGEAVMPLVSSRRPDAVILDIAMPGPSGYALAQEIRAAYAGKRRPLVIAITGQYTRPSDRLLSQVVGFDHYLVKPYEPRTVLALLDALMLPPAQTAARTAR